VNELLSPVLTAPLSAVVAGTGFGKTEAVAHFLREGSVKMVWIQISKLDNSPLRFWDNFIHAFSMQNEALALGPAARGFPESEVEYARFADAFADAMAEESRLAVVFDDFHHIHDERVLKFLERDAASSVRNISRIFCSREMPPFFTPAHALRHNAVFISEDDLRFTREEIYDFLALQGFYVNPDMIENIYENTEGWAFAVSLAAFALKQDPKDEKNVLGVMRANASRILENDVFGTLSENHQRSLVKLSLLNAPPSSLIRRLDGGTELIAQLDRGGAFIRYNEQTDRWHIHHIFREFLKGKQFLLTEPEMLGVFRNAAEWYFENAMLLDAIYYFEKCGAYERILDAAFDLSLITPREIRETVVRALSGAPLELFRRDARAYILLARFLLDFGRQEEAEALVLNVMNSMDDEADSEYKNALLCGISGVMGIIAMRRCLYTGKYDFAKWFRAAAAYAENGAYYAPLGGKDISFNLGSYVCMVSKDTGDFEAYFDELGEAMPAIRRYMGNFMSGLRELALCEWHYYRGSMEECEQYARLSAVRARAGGQYEIENRALFFLLRKALAKGTPDETERVLSEIRAQPLSSDFPERRKLLETILGWLYAQLGCPESAPPWIKGDILPEREEVANEQQQFVRAKYYIAAGEWRALLAMMDTAGEGFGAHAILLGEIGSSLNKAICHYRLKNPESALDALRAAYELANPHGFIMAFTEAANDMRALCEFALKSAHTGIDRDWLVHIHSKSSSYAKRLAQVKQRILTGSVETSCLTKAERDILAALAKGMTRKEIAEDSHISINTVKTILSDAISKLGAHNATEATCIALSKGLLSESLHI
jgi:LuxR family maltose regulon positive regulatory protein